MENNINKKIEKYESMKEDNLSPAMKQYRDLKLKYPECIIMFRMGDFYEMFYDDAVIASRELEITLTSRGKGNKKAPLAGIPYHSLTMYLKKFIKKGYKIAIVEQLENPKYAKGRLVKRDVVRIITPGTILDDELLDSKGNNYLLSIYGYNDNLGVSLCDISTGELIVFNVNSLDDFKNEITKYSPKECIFPKSININSKIIEILKDENIYLSPRSDVIFGREYSKTKLMGYFDENKLKQFGINLNDTNIIRSLGGLLSYIEENEKSTIKQINSIKKINISEYMMLDSSTIKNLELVENIINKTKDNTLFSVINKCKTPMGYRLMYNWILRPLVNISEINKRLDSVEELVNDLKTRQIYELLNNVKDIERINSKIASKTVNPRELISLANSLKAISIIKEKIKTYHSDLLKYCANMNELSELSDKIFSTIIENPPVKINNGMFIKPGFSKELDELKNIKSSAKSLLFHLENREKERTGINNLKIGYNSVFGYYIQVSKSKINLIPKDYVLKQTLVSSNRYITDSLKELENKILGAEERIIELEIEIYQSFLTDINQYVNSLKETSSKIALLDCLVSFAIVSMENNYVKPIIDNSGEIEIIEGRHPVVERSKQNFVPNDLIMKRGEIIILTGPNMAGKSTYLRQICLITIMSQIGCFVPANSSRIGIVDKIFSRVGAYDDITHGQSTFMIEMKETANILKNATNKSLIILDEVGRGTSTYDGISIAWAVVEYLHNHIKAKTIFATHYHYLNNLQDKYENIINYQMLVKEKENEIIFLRKVARGGTNKSYGIEVAKLSGLPIEVINRAKEIQTKLLSDNENKFKSHKQDIQSTLDFFS